MASHAPLTPPREGRETLRMALSESGVCLKHGTAPDRLLPPLVPRCGFRRQVGLGVESVEKVRSKKLQKNQPPYLVFKRRSRIEVPFRYPQFGTFLVVWTFSTNSLAVAEHLW